MQGVRLIWGPLNTGFTVLNFCLESPEVLGSISAVFSSTVGSFPEQRLVMEPTEVSSSW